MSDQSGGPGWWQASDGKWYPPQPSAPDSSPMTPEPAGGDHERVSWWTRRVPLWALIVAAVAGIALGAATASAPEDDDGGETASASASSTTTVRRSTTTTVRRTTTTTAPPYTPVPTDFAIEVIETEKNCFGSAGCNVAFTIDVSYVGAQPPDPSETFTVIYDILGGEDAQTDSFEVNGDQITYTKEGRISTTASSAVLTAVPNRVV